MGKHKCIRKMIMAMIASINQQLVSHAQGGVKRN